MAVSIIKFFFRVFIFPTLYFFRILNLIHFSKNKLLIITYHGVTEKKNLKYNGRHFSKRIFEKHLKYFKRHFDVVPLSIIFDYYRQNKKPSRLTIAITFDDGFENNYTVAFPLLQQYNIPATFFISAVCIDNPTFILWPEIINIIRQNEVSSIIVKDIVFVNHQQYDYINMERKLTFSEFIKKQTAQERDKILEDIKEKYKFNEILKTTPSDIWQLMNKEQIVTLGESNLIEIASHGYLHYNLANIEDDIAFEDLQKSKELLEQLTKKHVISIAFPDSSYNERIKKISLSLGYKNMCAVLFVEKNDINDPDILPRYGMSSTTNYYSNIFFLHKAFKEVGF